MFDTFGGPPYDVYKGRWSVKKGRFIFVFTRDAPGVKDTLGKWRWVTKRGATKRVRPGALVGTMDGTRIRVAWVEWVNLAIVISKELRAAMPSLPIYMCVPVTLEYERVK